MSCDNWEAGTIKLPAGAATAVKKAVREAHNKRCDAAFATAKALYPKISRKKDPRQAFSELDYTESRTDADDERHELVEEILFKWDGHKSVPRRPTKANVPYATTRTVKFACGEAQITFDGSSVHYGSGENNHAVEHANEDAVVIAFFRALDRVKWTSRTGGTLVGNDEYHREGCQEGDGGNYVTRRFGKDAKKVSKSARGRGTYRWAC